MLELRKMDFRSRLRISQMNSNDILVVLESVVLLRCCCLPAPVVQVAFMTIYDVNFEFVWFGLTWSYSLGLVTRYPSRVLSEYHAIHPFGDWTTTPACQLFLPC